MRSLLTFTIVCKLALLPLNTAQAQKRLNEKWSKRNPPTAPAELIFEENIAYRKGHDRWVLNVIRPEETSPTPRAAIVVVHGGAWSSNDHYRFSSLAFLLAQKGYVVITPTHRLIRDAPFPACLEDIKNSVRWLKAHARKYNVDPNRIGAYGNSSGGQLALMTSLTGHNREIEGDGPYQDYSSEIQAVVCSGTPGDMQHDSHSLLAKRVYRALATSRKTDLPEEKIQSIMKQASPITHVRKDAPPTLMVHGEKDRTVKIESTDLFVKEMKAVEANITYMRYVDGGHAVMFQKQSETIPAMLKFFDNHLQPKNTKEPE